MRNDEQLEATLIGVLIMAAAIAAIGAGAGILYLHLSVWLAFVLYAVIGAAAVLFIGWRRYRCAEARQPEAKIDQ